MGHRLRAWPIHLLSLPRRQSVIRCSDSHATPLQELDGHARGYACGRRGALVEQHAERHLARRRGRFGVGRRGRRGREAGSDDQELAIHDFGELAIQPRTRPHPPHATDTNPHPSQGLTGTDEDEDGTLLSVLNHAVWDAEWAGYWNYHGTTNILAHVVNEVRCRVKSRYRDGRERMEMNGTETSNPVKPPP